MLRELIDRFLSAFREAEPKKDPYAEKSESAHGDLNKLEAQIEMAAQKTLDKIDDAFVAWQSMKHQEEREAKAIKFWTDRLEDAQRNGWAELAAEAEASLLDAQKRFAVWEEALAQVGPQIEDALRIVDQVGLSRDAALSQTERLRAELATAEGKRMLASIQLDGPSPDVESLFEQAKEKIEEVSARAAAEAEIAGNEP